MSKISNAQVAAWVTRGTTTPADKVIVLYNDGDWALVKWPSNTLSSGSGLFRDYVPAWVTQYDLSRVGLAGLLGIDVWSCARDADGPMTLRNLEKLVTKQNLCKEYICYTPVKRGRGKQEPAIVPTKTEKSRRFKLCSCSVQVGMLIEGDTPQEWEDRLCKVAIVGKIVETGTQINGDYLVLEYNNVTDCMEFIKADREALIDSLEASICGN
jgi:hypothetical protein